MRPRIVDHAGLRLAKMRRWISTGRLRSFESGELVWTRDIVNIE